MDVVLNAQKINTNTALIFNLQDQIDNIVAIIGDGDLEQVLTNGNSAGANGINMNNQNITQINQIECFNVNENANSTLTGFSLSLNNYSNTNSAVLDANGSIGLTDNGNGARMDITPDGGLGISTLPPSDRSVELSMYSGLILNNTNENATLTSSGLTLNNNGNSAVFDGGITLLDNGNGASFQITPDGGLSNGTIPPSDRNLLLSMNDGLILNDTDTNSTLTSSSLTITDPNGTSTLTSNNLTIASITGVADNLNINTPLMKQVISSGFVKHNVDTNNGISYNIEFENTTNSNYSFRLGGDDDASISITRNEVEGNSVSVNCAGGVAILGDKAVYNNTHIEVDDPLQNILLNTPTYTQNVENISIKHTLSKDAISSKVEYRITPNLEDLSPDRYEIAIGNDDRTQLYLNYNEDDINENVAVLATNGKSGIGDYYGVLNGTKIEIDDPSQNILLNTENLTFTGAGLQSDNAGGNSGEHLVITLNGVQYKIKLENP